MNIAVSSETKFAAAEVYELYGDTAEIRTADGIENIPDNTFNYTLKPLSVTEFVLHKKETAPPIVPIAAVGAAAIAAVTAVIVIRRKSK